MGQAVLDVLSGYQNQAWLGGITGISTGYGIGNYTSEGYGGSGPRFWARRSAPTTRRSLRSRSRTAGRAIRRRPTVVIAGPCNVQAVFTANVSRRRDHQLHPGHPRVSGY